MARSRDLSKVLSSSTALATDAEVASTYATKLDFPSDAWTSYTPTFGGGTWAVGNGVFTNTKYIQIGKIVHVKGQFNLGSTTVKDGSNGLTISLPVTAGSPSNGVGGCTFLDSGTAWYFSGAYVNASDSFLPLDITVNTSKLRWSGVVATQPFTWATNDVIIWSFTYEAA